MALAGLVLNATAMSLPAQAAGETYTWTDTTYTGITATGGGYSGTATFARTSTSGAAATFTSTASYICSGAVQTAALTLAIDGANYASGKPLTPTSVAVNGPPAVVCAALDARPTVNAAGTTPAAADAAATATASANCDQGSFSWLACPLIDNLSSAISSLATSALTPFLKVNVITPASAPQLYAVWANLRDVADAFFILIFFVIIFATMTGQDFMKLDQYTIKKIWPYLVAAAILVQFSFLICGLLVDVGNIAGAGVSTLITSVIQPSKGAASGTNVGENIGTGILAGIGLTGAGLVALGSLVSAVPLLLSLFISLFVVFLTLGLRFLLIAILIAGAPLACIALVLPNTRHWFNDWLTFLFRLILMYPLIIGIFSIAGIINEVLPFSANTATNGGVGVAIEIMKVIIVIATFLLIPATFRFAGKGLERAHGLLNGTAVRGKSALRSSDMWQRGKEERDARKAGYMRRVLDSKGITKLQGSGRAGQALAGGFAFGAGAAFLNAPKDRPALKKLQSRLASSAKKSLDEMDEATPGNMLKLTTALTDPDTAKRKQAFKELQADAPNFLSLAQNSSGRVAIIKRMAELELVSPNTIQGFVTSNQKRNFFSVSHNMAGEYPSLLGASGKQYSGNPAILARITKPVSDHKIENAVGGAIDYLDVNGRTQGPTISRSVGDVNMDGLARGIRKVTPGTFGDKHAVGNFRVMTTTGNAQLDKAAHDVAISYAMNMDKTTIEKAFDPSNPRTFATREARLEWVKGMQAHHNAVAHYNQDLIEATASGFVQDSVLTKDIASIIGMSQHQADALSNTARAFVADEWLRGRAYNPATDGGRDLETEAQAWLRRRP